MKSRHLTLGVILLGSALLAWFGDNRPAQVLSEPTQRVASTAKPITATADARATSAGPAAPTPLILIDRPTLIGRTSQSQHSLFDQHSWTPPPPILKPLPPPPPTAPPVPFKYLGKSNEGGQWQVFLARNETTYIVRENESLETQYRIEKINPPTMTLIYLPLNQTQSLTIE